MLALDRLSFPGCAAAQAGIPPCGGDVFRVAVGSEREHAIPGSRSARAGKTKGKEGIWIPPSTSCCCWVRSPADSCGLAGFGTALMALGIWLYVLPPALAVPLVLICSVVAQTTTLRRCGGASTSP